MIDQGKIQGIIDWSSARGGFAEEDFCPLEFGEWSERVSNKSASVAFWALLIRVSGSLIGVNIKVRILTPIKEPKIGQNGSKNRRSPTYWTPSEHPSYKKSFLEGYAKIRKIPDYQCILPLLRLNRAIRAIGFTVKRGTWQGKGSKIYQFNRQYLDSFLDAQKSSKIYFK
jgi:hypothetical protein